MEGKAVAACFGWRKKRASASSWSVVNSCKVLLHYCHVEETTWNTLGFRKQTIFPWNSSGADFFQCITINHHHHHVMPLARISLTLSRHFSLYFIASGRSSGLHPVSSHICWMYVRAGHPAFARPFVGVHKSTSLMSSSLLLQQCPACLVRLT